MALSALNTVQLEGASSEKLSASLSLFLFFCVDVDDDEDGDELGSVELSPSPSLYLLRTALRP